MASHSSEQTLVEGRGLLRPTSSFEIEDGDFAEQNYKRTTRSGGNWLDARRAWDKFPAWANLRGFCIGLTAAITVVSIILLLVILVYDEAVYRSQRHKINNAMVTKLNDNQMAKRPLAPSRIPIAPSRTPTTAISTHSQSSVKPHAVRPKTKAQKFEKPSGFKIIALIFYGRPSVVAVLDCYLKRNLVSNGGFLDEVHWAINTENQEDLAYLDELVKTTDSYKKIDIPGFGYNSIWEHAVEPEHLYIKIDDDIVRAFYREMTTCC